VQQYVPQVLIKYPKPLILYIFVQAPRAPFIADNTQSVLNVVFCLTATGTPTWLMKTPLHLSYSEFVKMSGISTDVFHEFLWYSLDRRAILSTDLL